ncbi:hypothetical protein PR202_ga28407 [Eleusine coracana subsp. coracana]|uniref:Uncharacterized protein n=1 Tax=Eleusine coracana subsp. coracana TaxID=191504 RepID=A0AAV5DIH0_ELECO|nr:hypothetical protein PR202_ga28407 [Eleusine coracana subsp. coracana]
MPGSSPFANPELTNGVVHLDKPPRNGPGHGARARTLAAPLATRLAGWPTTQPRPPRRLPSPPFRPCRNQRCLSFPACLRSPMPPMPAVTLPPMPAVTMPTVPTVPGAALPPMPAVVVPAVPKVTLPPMPAVSGIPKVTLPPMPSIPNVPMPAIPNVPMPAIPGVPMPFAAPPPKA